MNLDKTDDEWQKLWDARLAALESELGTADNVIGASALPIYLGGGADILTFRNHIDGIRTSTLPCKWLRWVDFEAQRLRRVSVYRHRPRGSVGLALA